MKVPFTKMHGLGNCYIYVDLFKHDIKEEMVHDLAKRISNVHTGIGSDGLILIQPGKKVPIGMRIFNKDGSEGMNCGNGLRCVAKYAYENHLVCDNEFQIETKAGLVDAIVNLENNKVKEVTINMGSPSLARPQIPMKGKGNNPVINESFFINDTELKITAVSMGNPHVILFVSDIESAPLYDLGPTLATDSRFPEGVNVGFVEIMNERELYYRVWGRGSGVTQACGTGACAAVVASILNDKMNNNDSITVHLPGGDLKIILDDHHEVWMTGGAETIATGIYYVT